MRREPVKDLWPQGLSISSEGCGGGGDFLYLLWHAYLIFFQIDRNLNMHGSLYHKNNGRLKLNNGESPNILQRHIMNRRF